MLVDAWLDLLLLSSRELAPQTSRNIIRCPWRPSLWICNSAKPSSKSTLSGRRQTSATAGRCGPVLVSPVTSLSLPLARMSLTTLHSRTCTQVSDGWRSNSPAPPGARQAVGGSGGLGDVGIEGMIRREWSRSEGAGLVFVRMDSVCARAERSARC